MKASSKEYKELRNLIRESFSNIIQEKDNRRSIIERLKMPDYVAEWAHNISDKHSIWIVDDFKSKFLLDIIPSEVIRNAAILQLERGLVSGGLHRTIRKSMNDFEGEYRYIVDWLQGRNNEPVRETDKINFKELEFNDAMRRARAWHDEVAMIQGGTIDDEDGDVIITFPDGYYWVNLGTDYCSKEGGAMGHCGRGEGKLYSLRKEGIPYVTADILTDGTVRQMRGRANTKPKEKFHPYIIALIKSEIITNFEYWNYRINDNFMLKDLGREKAMELINEKPSLAQHQNLEEL
jgi:hypothetical protein